MATKTQNPKLTRAEKAAAMYAAGVQVKKTEDGWLVPGSNPLSEYEVRCEYDQWLCSCPDATFRGHGGSATDLCKHSQLIRIILDMEKLHEQIISKREQVVVF